MKTQGLSKKQIEEAKQAARVKLPEMEKTFYLFNGIRWNAEFSSIPQFDVWACAFYEEITGVNREVWDVFARWKFINTLIDAGKLEKQYQADGRIFLVEVEEKSSDSEADSEVPK